jgi:hypothetical protein
MSDFVEQCRREWGRLGVPDPVANEMATDLAADLKEAEAEGVLAEEVLGRSVFDPRSFAASWPAERGVIPSASSSTPYQASASRKPPIPAVLATLAVIGLLVAVLIALPGGSRSVAMAPTLAHPRAPFAPPAPSGPFGLHDRPFAVDALAWIVFVLVAVLGVIGAGWLWSRWVRLRPPTAPA